MGAAGGPSRGGEGGQLEETAPVEHTNELGVSMGRIDKG
jgi:hypothetical protein